MTDKNDNKTKKQSENEKVEDKEIKKDEAVLLKEKVEELENQVKRTLADYQNLEKRVAQERKTWMLNSNKQLILRLLPVLDTIISANKHLKDQGITLCIQQFLEILKQEGVKEIPPTVGAKFDPCSMECIEVAEGEDGKVMEEIRTGYQLNDEIIRPVQVRVGSEKKNQGEEKGEN